MHATRLLLCALALLLVRFVRPETALLIVAVLGVFFIRLRG